MNKPKWRSWLLPFIIAFALTFWSVVFALFFLAIIWIMLLNPKTNSKEFPFPSDQDRKHAKRTYAWLLLSPFLTVPTMIIAAFNLDWNSSPNERVLAALIPLVFHLPMLFKLNTKSAFVYRHTQQAIFLVALRAGMASIALSIGTYPGDGAWLFLLGNGTLWLFGTMWGRNQVLRNECWWMKRKGETILLPEAKPATTTAPKQPITSAIQKNKPAIEGALHTFRTGAPEERKQAVLALSQLGEVEKF